MTAESTSDSRTAPKIVGPTDGESVSLGAIGARFMIDTEEVPGGAFSLVEHPMPPRALAAPLHRHSREDEYSYVVEGRMGALLGGEVVHAEVGDLVFKPRDQWHTFWNAGDEPCRILEIICPGRVRGPVRRPGREAGGRGDGSGRDRTRSSPSSASATGSTSIRRPRLRSPRSTASGIRSSRRRRTDAASFPHVAGGDVYASGVSAPTALIMAAGQGTRMRSEVPKVLHEVCGRPMVAWPILAAREAGAARVCVIVSPDKDLSHALPEGTETVVQPTSDGTGGALRAAREAIAASETVLVLSGDHPLISAEIIGELVSAHEEAGAGATVMTTELDEPGSYGRIVRGDDGDVERIVEAKEPGDATEEELAITEVNAGTYAFAGAPLAEALEPHRQRQRPGRVLPGRRSAPDPRGRPAHRGLRVPGPGGQPRRQRPGRPRARHR